MREGIKGGHRVWILEPPPILRLFTARANRLSSLKAPVSIVKIARDS